MIPNMSPPQQKGFTISNIPLEFVTNDTEQHLLTKQVPPNAQLGESIIKILIYIPLLNYI